jgi:DNA-binding LacI/PurR family transcriptional regulator
VKRFRGGGFMRVTIKDIARELNVSIGSVSTALNNKKGISDKLKEKIQRKAKKMNYIPNVTARNLVRQETKNIAVFIFTRSKENKDAFNLPIFRNLLEAANKRGYNLLVYGGDNNFLDKEAYIKFCLEENVAGAIIFGMKLEDPNIQTLKDQQNVPIVLFDVDIGGYTNVVKTDNDLGVKRALNYLYTLGHRKIAILKGHSKAQVTHERWKSVEKFLKSKGIYNKDLIVSGNFSERSGYEAGKKLFLKKNDFTAIFCFSDLMAVGALEFFKENKIIAPNKISVLGFDNIPLCEYLDPPLTSVAPDTKGIVEEIVRIIEDKEMKKQIKIKPSLEIRKSCKKINY